MSALVRWFVVGALFVLTVPVAAQVTYPAPPQTYDVHIRYRIRTDRDERIRQFKAMHEFLKSQGYVATRRADDDLDIFNPDAELTNGTIPAAGALKLLDQPSVKTVVLVPAGGTALADPKALAQVRLGIASGYPPGEQRKLHEQVVARLGRLGFKEAVGYDHQKFALVRGAIPAGEVLGLLKDLRTLPAGYFFGPTGADELPQPFASVLPIRSVEVLAAQPAATVTDADPGPFTADLAAILANPVSAERPLTVEAVFDPDVLDGPARSRLRLAAPGVSLNGVIGPVATLRLNKASAALMLAKVPGVFRLRLPRLANESVVPVSDAKTPDFVTASKTDALFKLGYTGTGAKVVVIGSDFSGWEKLAGKELPKDVRYLDLTAEADAVLKPLPLEPGRASGGLPAAVAAHRTAPGAALHLVRIDPAQMHQLLTVLRAVSGDTSVSVAQRVRVEEATVKSEQLRAARQAVNEEYRKAFDNLSDDPAAAAARQAVLTKIKQRQDDEAEYTAAVNRYLALRSGIEGLKNAEVVVNTLVWEAGFPHDGLNEIGKELEAKLNARAGLPALKAAKLPPPTGWVQAGGLSTGQVWAGPWMDRDGNGALEFDSSTAGPAPGLWSKELNVLNYVPLGGKGGATLPAGLKVRISVQWREPHDPNGFPPDGSIFPMRLRVLRQVDPTGKTHATDDLIEVARAQGNPVRLARTRGSETFEHFVDVTLPAGGVYGVRLDGLPRFEKLALGLIRNLEPRIRVFVELLDVGERAKGKVVFQTYSDNTAGVGVPADSVAALTVTTPDSLRGLGPGVTLGAKPDATVDSTVTVDGKTYAGPAVAAGYAGGLSGSLADLGIRPTDLLRTLGLKSGSALVLPPEWLSTVTPKANRVRER